MLATRLGRLLGIRHPVIQGGMGTGTTPELVAAVSNAGGLGILGGCAGLDPSVIGERTREIRALTGQPFGLNLLLFRAEEPSIAAVLKARPAVFSTAWAKADQDLKPLFSRARDVGAKVMHMVSGLEDAERAAEAGAEVIVAQGTEGGGHVGLVGTVALVPTVAKAVAPIPVVAAGGLADGAGLAAALMLGAEAALYGTRFLASREAAYPPGYQRSITGGTGQDTVVTSIPDLASGLVWPGAWARVKRNRFIETWAGREGELRYRQSEAAAAVRRAREEDDPDQGVLYSGQSAGLIDAVEPAAAIVERIVAEATTLLRDRAPSLLSPEV